MKTIKKFYWFDNRDILFGVAGVSVFAGAAFLILLIPANGYITAKLGDLQTKLMTYKDERMKVMNELLSGIKVCSAFFFFFLRQCTSGTANRVHP